MDEGSGMAVFIALVVLAYICGKCCKHYEIKNMGIKERTDMLNRERQRREVREYAAHVAAFGAVNATLICPHCQQKGSVRTKQPFDPGRISHEFKAVARTAGLEHLTFHQLRHAAATMMLTQGVPLKTVQEVLGHSTYYVTADVSGHVVPELQRVAADAMEDVMAGILADSQPE
ncbi:MAG: tyrosine-type recombinase/integrase [Gaiellales bacterium]|nr:tyrosine-type recombinase/integrase [Gaiellales bacterium]